MNKEKKPHDPIEQVARDLKDAWNGAVKDVGEMSSDVTKGLKTYVSDPARDGINFARREGTKFYKVVEDKVGRDRLIGAGLGAGKLGTVGSVFGPLGTIKGTVIGGVAGFVLGRAIKNWLDGDQNNEPPADSPPKTSDTGGPTDPNPS